MHLSNDDIAYIQEHFIRLEDRPDGGPGPSYVLEDGTQYYPRDYGELERDEARFKARLRAEMNAQGVSSLDADETWDAYLTGIYGVCLHAATPENIVRKSCLLQRIDDLTAAPREHDNMWIAELRQAVDALDLLERPFSPHYDRVRFGRPPTRDSHIAAVRERFPQITQAVAL